MDLMPYVERLQRDLAVAAAAGGEEARALAERLTAPLEAATRVVAHARQRASQATVASS